jgi:hypothetical protein
MIGGKDLILKDFKAFPPIMTWAGLTAAPAVAADVPTFD